uniref:helix-turn-helix transcriptional regulator n=1 Tax=Amycolatopsis sp. CA-096443 TaxID=3239919 RepID=UPI003F4992D3
MAQDEQPVGNGLRTDHPVPNLPFVDDGHIPVDDPEAIEAIGRCDGAAGVWGRWDGELGEEWSAYTTDPKNPAFSWVVRFHPDHGRSVTLYRNRDGGAVHDRWFGERALLVRLGGYWWDGATWYRPGQVFSWASEACMRRPVRLATTVTAEDLLDYSCRAALGRVAKVARLDPDALPAVDSGQWGHDLALWNRQRHSLPGALPTDQCAVTLSAPELADSEMLGVEEFAREAGIAVSTLRAYIARGEAGVPTPQTVHGNRRRWSRPVVADWREQRRRDPRTVAENPDPAVPFESLSTVLESAVLHELGRHRTDALSLPVVGLSRHIGTTLGWYMRNELPRTQRMFGAIARQAEQDLDLPRKVTRKSLRRALLVDGEFDSDEHLDRLFDVAWPPEN